MCVAQVLDYTRQKAAQQLVWEVTCQGGDGGHGFLLHHGACSVILEDLECDLLQRLYLHILQQRPKAACDFDQDVNSIAVCTLLQVHLQHTLGHLGQALLRGLDDVVPDQSGDEHPADGAVRIKNGLCSRNTSDGTWQ